IPIPRGPPLTGRNQKSEREKVVTCTPLFFQIVPARLTIWTTNLELAARPMSGGVQRQGLGLVPGVPAKSFTIWMSDAEPGVTIASGSLPTCSWVDNCRSGRLSGLLVSSVGEGRSATLTCPTYTAEYSVTSWVVVVLFPLADTGTMPCERTAGRVRRVIVRIAGMILVCLCRSRKFLTVDNFRPKF